MKSLVLFFASLLFIACNCDGSRTVDCSTPEKCNSPACVNTGCNFDDAGKPLPPKILGAPKPKALPIEFEKIALGERKMVTLDRATAALPTQCSHDELGAALFADVTEEAVIRATVGSPNQLSLAVFHIDRLGKRKLVECVRSFSPKVERIKLVPGRWEFVITGKGKAELFLEKRMTKKPLSFTTTADPSVVAIEPGDEVSLAFNRGEGTQNKSVCGSSAPSYRVRIKLSAASRLSVSLPSEFGPVQLGMKRVGTTTPPNCAPPINQNLSETLEPGEYDLFVESAAAVETLHKMPWQVSIAKP